MDRLGGVCGAGTDERWGGLGAVVGGGGLGAGLG